jgi:hypothetical protein
VETREVRVEEILGGNWVCGNVGMVNGVGKGRDLTTLHIAYPFFPFPLKYILSLHLHAFFARNHMKIIKEIRRRN